MHKLHKKIGDKVAQNNVNYKLRVDIRNRLKTFNISGVVKSCMLVVVTHFKS